MKTWLLIILFLVTALHISAQSKSFRFVFISDTHIGSPDGAAEEDLRRTVRDINSMTDVAFVVITGDITELGTNAELLLAKKLLDSLHIPWYIIPGNHDTGWSESGGLSFTKTFGSDKFYFTYNGIHFIGCASGPYVRMSDGHVPRDAMNWMKKTLAGIDVKEPVIFLNHYPLDEGLDNWYEVIDLLKKRNTVLALCGHGHNNRGVKAEDIPAVMGRSNLRAKQAAGGYNLVDVRADSFIFTERNPLTKQEKIWKSLPYRNMSYDLGKKFPRPDFSVNEKFSQVKNTWTFQSDANVISTPAILNDLVVFGNHAGIIQGLKISNGKQVWQYKTDGPIFSSPAVSKDKLVVGSADGNIYCINHKGKLIWKFKTNAAVLASPLIDDGTVYIGGSDSNFRAVDLETGQQKWTFSQLKGPVVSNAVIDKNIIVFGAWDTNLYAVDKSTGSLLWKWNNGSSVRNYSPAACIPVISDGVVYVAAPDRYLTAIDLQSGKTLWRTNEATVRESIGISENGKLIYGKTMNDTVVAYVANKDKAEFAWKMNAGYKYEHAPSMLVEKNSKLFFGTRNGLVYCINRADQSVDWIYKIDNSMVNTVNVISDKKLIASTMDGKVCLLTTSR